MLAPPLCDTASVEHEVKVPVVVNGEVVLPQTAVKDKPSAATPPPVKTGPSPSGQKRVYTPEDLKKMADAPCREHAAGKCKFGQKCRFKH